MPQWLADRIGVIGEMLPDCIDGNKLLKDDNGMLFNLDGNFIKSSKKDNEYKIYIDGLTNIIIFLDKNEVYARAKMLIYLLENKLMNLK